MTELRSITPSALHHGGRLRQAAEEYGIPFEKWLDLSTGVSPWTYPVGEMPVASWNRLPECEDGLEAAARSYYGCPSLLPVAGSQAAIQAIPKLWRGRMESQGRWQSGLKVLLPRVGYKEHQKAWQRAGWQVVHYEGHPGEVLAPEIAALVVINPNNPTAEVQEKGSLLAWHQQLLCRHGLLLVDEAFADVEPAESLSPLCPQPGLVVLRSIGKFFGLAGIRAGFVLAEPWLLAQLTDELGPWTLAGPSRIACRRALEDKEWQARQAERLTSASNRLHQQLKPLGGRLCGTGLFQTLYHPRAAIWHKQLCGEGILVRLTDEGDGLRFGLPLDESQWQRLAEALPLLITYS
ncbi:threonine-phosphate decarboxylase CobD [Ferrimonas sp. YFM]|uniref:threonine-phosphate decarboxylase CobD n=1 Tax=Ferrimonas sp. YFM TaxID=3028878 RepID=UPI0025725384|nr:threonine-phosphate decarboxylase CobD [Ferrimonas sp. YFM]BDY05233.1 threonine-phosphate decarboxylase [Ferrimonas sp. YFM]